MENESNLRAIKRMMGEAAAPGVAKTGLVRHCPQCGQRLTYLGTQPGSGAPLYRCEICRQQGLPAAFTTHAPLMRMSDGCSDEPKMAAEYRQQLETLRVQREQREAQAAQRKLEDEQRAAEQAKADEARRVAEEKSRRELELETLEAPDQARERIR